MFPRARPFSRRCIIQTCTSGLCQPGEAARLYCIYSIQAAPPGRPGVACCTTHFPLDKSCSPCGSCDGGQPCVRPVKSLSVLCAFPSLIFPRAITVVVSSRWPVTLCRRRYNTQTMYVCTHKCTEFRGIKRRKIA